MANPIKVEYNIDQSETRFLIGPKWPQFTIKKSEKYTIQILFQPIYDRNCKMSDIGNEIRLCARYGEDDDLKSYLSGKEMDHVNDVDDMTGNTALHMGKRALPFHSSILKIHSTDVYNDLSLCEWTFGMCRDSC